MQKKLFLQVGARCNWNFFNIAVNYFDAKKFARYSQVLVVTELVASGTQCIFYKYKCSLNNKRS